MTAEELLREARIMTTSKKIPFYLFGLILLCWFLLPSLLQANISVKDLENIRKQHFNNITEPAVKKISANSEDYYFILVYTYSYFKSDDRNITRKLTLRAKSLLYKYLKEKDLNLGELKLQQFFTGLQWKENDKTYLLSYIACKNVSPVYSKEENSENNTKQSDIKSGNKSSVPKDEKEKVSESSLNQNLDKEIIYLSDIIKNNPNSIPAYEELCELYKLKGDIDKVNELLDKIMLLKFNKNNE